MTTKRMGSTSDKEQQTSGTGSAIEVSRRKTSRRRRRERRRIPSPNSGERRERVEDDDADDDEPDQKKRKWRAKLLNEALLAERLLDEALVRTRLHLHHVKHISPLAKEEY